MKNKNQKPEAFEIIFPFEGEDGPFDDCPLCQELKKKIEDGEVEELGELK